MKVFLGSSQESAPVMNELAVMVKDCGHTPVKWSDPGLFPAGEFTLETLHGLTSRVDAAVFVFAADDVLWYRGDATPQARDNVLIEYGLFSGVLGHKRALLCQIGQPHSPSDIQGVTVLSYSDKRKHKFRSEFRAWMDGISQRQPALALPAVFVHSKHPQFIEEVQRRVNDAGRVVMIGTGLDVLGNLDLVVDLIARCRARMCRAEIYMGDPFSLAIESRLVEEERSDTKPEVRKNGIVRRLEMLLNSWRSAGRPEQFSVRVFTHYPTFALIIIDDDYFVYPYGYCLLGNVAPVLRFSRSNGDHSAVVAFLDKHYENVAKDALDGELAYRARTQGIENAKDLFSFAVYFIPSADSSLYRFGTDLIGYDIRRGETTECPWPDSVGSAVHYGIHLTICDCLYFLTKGEVENVIEETKFLARDFKPFDMRVLPPKLGFPGDGVISLPVEDIEGALTVLHCELVQRVYRRAVATDDSLGGPAMHSQKRKLNGIERQLLRRFGAPYVLVGYRPHFTLLRSLPSATIEREGLFELVRQMVDRHSVAKSIRVDRLAIMSRVVDTAQWVIHEEIELGSRG